MFSFDCAWHITRQGHGQTLMVTCCWHAVCLVPPAVKYCHSLVFASAPGSCFDYNYKGKCLKPLCRYAHMFLRCKASHPVSNCSKSSNFVTQGLRLILSSHGPNSQGVILLTMWITSSCTQDHVLLSIKSHLVPLMEKGKSPINIDILDCLLDRYPNTEDADYLKMVFDMDFHWDTPGLGSQRNAYI